MGTGDGDGFASAELRKTPLCKVRTSSNQIQSGSYAPLIDMGTVLSRRMPRETAKDPALHSADFVRLDSEQELRPPVFSG